MKKILVAALALFSFTSNAQKLDDSLLWKISGNGLSMPSYLFGTIHITCDATLDEKTLKALDETYQLYLELDMDDPALQSQMMSMAMMKDGKKLSDLASKEDIALLDAFLQKNTGMTTAVMNTVKPAMITMMLLPKMSDCPMESFEMELVNVAKKQKETISGLETTRDQMAVFDKIPYEEQMAELIKTANDNMAGSKEEFKKMMDIYKTKNLDKILAILNESDNKMYGDHADVLLTDRNKNWIPKIETAAKQTPTFFAVGAAHLGGKEGVIMLLRGKGYKVEAVK